jgi:CHAT domain-containing protein/Tfp pilus assembly protein PilF
MIRIVILSLGLLIFSSYQLPTSTSNSDIQDLIDLKEEAADNGKYDLAYEKSTAIAILYTSNKEWESAIKYFNDAIIYSAYSNSGKNKSLVHKTLQIADEHLKDDNLYKAAIYQHYGEMLADQEQYDSARHYLNIAFQTFSDTKKSNWKENKANIQIVLATIFYLENRYSDAIDDLLEVVEETKRIDDAEYILDMAYNLLGVIYYDQQDFEKAIAVTQKAANLIEKIEYSTYEDSFYLANIYQNLGVFYQTLQDNKRSKLYFETALDYYRLLDISKDETIDVLTNYGLLLFKNNELPEAIKKLKEALFINQQFPDIPSYLSNNIRINRQISNTYEKSNLIDSAFYFINQSIYYAKQLKDSSRIAALEIQRGRLHYQNNELQIAQNLILKAIPQISAKVPNQERHSLHHAYNTLGKIHHNLGEYDLALQYFQQALLNNMTEKDNEDITTIQNVYRIDYFVESLENKAATFEKIETLESQKNAHEYYQVALEWIRKMRQDVTFESSKVFLNENSHRIYRKALARAYQLYKTTNEERYLEATFAIVEEQKSILLLENLIGEERMSVLNVPSDLRKREQELKSKLAYYQQKILEVNEDELVNKMYQDYFNDYQLSFAALKDSLSKLHQDYFDLEYKNAILDIATIQDKLLDENTAFIQFHKLDSSWLVFLIENDTQKLFSLPFGKAEQKQLNDLLLSISNRDFLLKENTTVQDFTTNSYQVFKSLFEPIVQQLSSSTESLTIATNGELNFLPFEILLKSPVDESKKNFISLPYLIKDYSFNYVYSGSLFQQNRKTYQSLRSNQQMLAFAPLYKNDKNAKTVTLASRGKLENLRNNLASLQGTSKEIKAISSYFDGYFEDSEEATETEFKSSIKDYGLLHLAMHGIADKSSEELAHLVFSNQSTDSLNDNKLYHYEITNLNTNAQLAVLSACETGIGQYVEGEGVMSLGRSFMYAGVPSVVMSLWKLEDNATSELMPLFYKYLAAGHKKSQALREAKLEYLDNTIQLKAHPFYWAGLVVLGEDQPLKESISFWSIRNIAIFSICSLLVFFFVKYRNYSR